MKKFLLIGLILLGYVASYAQTNHLRSYVALIDATREYKPIEKLYIQTDKPYYVTGDTIRLKAYLLKADYLTLTNHSRMLYVELDDQEGKPAKRMMLPLESGLAWGDIALDEKEVPHGSYTLRAYTNWMRNFGEEYIFKKDIYVSPASGNATLVKANFKQDGNKVETILQFTSLDGKPLLVKDMELKVMDGRKNLSKNQLNTGMGGTLNANFELPQTTTGPITIQAKDVTKGVTDATILIIPVTINRIENTDLQFMPEGGNLVAGIKTKVGFKAIAEDGKGTNIAGTILNSKQQEVATFKTAYAGMGSFEFTPQQNETYTAKVNGIIKSYILPIVNPMGTTLKVEQNINSDSLTIIITNNQPNSTNTNYNLIGQSRGVVCFAQTVSFSNNNSTQIFKAARSAFPTGIARFTLINASHQPTNERQVLINRNDQLHISITTNKPTYGIRDSIALAIEVKDKDGKPVEGNFSLAVTDDGQVKTDSLSSNILNNLLLTSDLKGNIENPNYYFIKPTKEKETDLDNLLLTQGWVGYNWKDVFYPSANPIAFKPETEFAISGTVTNAFGKPIEKSKVLILSKSPFVFKETLTNKEGKFTFNGFSPADTAIFKLQATNKNGKEFNVGIKMDEVKRPEFTQPSHIIPPWYVNSDSIRLKNTSAKSAQQKAIANYMGEGQMMKEVTIKEKKIVKGSKNLNGPGEADMIIDEEELIKADKMTLSDLLEKKVKGYSVNGIWSRILPAKGYVSSLLPYTLDSKKIKFVIDGIDIDYYYTGMPSRYFYIKNYLDYFTAEDVTGIEVMNSSKYSTKYHIDMARSEFSISHNFYAYIEITTRSKHGPFMKVTPGTYLYKTLPFTLPKKFYSPKYTVKNKTVAMGTDMRSTLHWEPNVMTNAEGKATVSFFSADRAANYTVIMDGVNLDGSIGHKRYQLINLKTP